MSRQAQGKKQKAYVSHLEDRLLCGDEELLGRVEGLPLVHQDLSVGAAKVNPKVETEAAHKQSFCFSFALRYVTLRDVCPEPVLANEDW